MEVGESHVLENMIRASLIFTVCFYGNLLSLLHFAVAELRGNNPFAVRINTTFLHLILELAGGELATKNIRTSAGDFAPHYVAMLEAAQYAEINTSVIEQFVRQLSQPAMAVTTICTQLSFGEEVKNYLVFSDRCTSTFNDSFATIALRELFLAEPFAVIAANLPRHQKFERYKTFLTSHVILDCSEHGTLMAEALGAITDVSKSLSTMIEFLQLRKAVYDACLSPKSIY